MAHFFSVVLLFFQFAGWGTALAGLALLTNQCVKSDNSDVDARDTIEFFGLGVTYQIQGIINYYGSQNLNNLGINYQCGMQWSWYWVVVFVQLVALLIGLAAQFSIHKAHIALIGTYATVTALWTIWVYPLIINAYLYYSILNVTTNKWGQGYVVASAGACAVLVGNFAFMFAQDGDSGAAYKQPYPAAPPPQGGFQVA